MQRTVFLIAMQLSSTPAATAAAGATDAADAAVQTTAGAAGC